jgi:hypothetical protein
VEQSPYPPPYPPEPERPEPAFLTGLVYGVLAVLGVLLGVVGSFEFAWEIAGIPVAAIGLSLVNLAVFRGAGWAMESRLGAVVPSVLWIIITLVLSSRRPEGDLVVTGGAPGYTYIFGGAVAALVAIVWSQSARPWLLSGAEPVPPR